MQEAGHNRDRKELDDELLQRLSQVEVSTNEAISPTLQHVRSKESRRPDGLLWQVWLPASIHPLVAFIDGITNRFLQRVTCR